MNTRLLRLLSLLAIVLLAVYIASELIPPEWAQPVRHFFREMLRALT